MFQVTFSNQCMRTLNGMPKAEQLALVDKISDLNEQVLQNPVGDLNKFQRDGQDFYRLRAEEYRIYFEQLDKQLKCHYVLHKNTLSDFIFRCKLPVGDEQTLEQHKSFWKYLESLGKNT
jgi:mRNA-degrading endonuclease RelE of RelBE toxin-antitoxin system